jgi:hypothetical protein
MKENTRPVTGWHYEIAGRISGAVEALGGWSIALMHVLHKPPTYVGLI